MNDRVPRFLAFASSLLIAAASAASAGGIEPASPPPPLTLDRAIELALARSPEVAVARARRDEAAAASRGIDAGFRPQALVSTTPGYSTGIPVAVAGQVPALFGAAVRTSLYDPAARAESLASLANAAGLGAGVALAANETVRAVVASYSRNAAGEGLVEAARRALEAREAIFRAVSALRREGRTTDVDVDRSELDVARAKQKLLDRSLSRDFDRLELARLIDRPDAASIVVAEDPAEAVPAPPPSGNLESARASDPQVAALSAEVETLSRAARLQARTFKPVIAAEAQYLRLARYNNFDQYFVRFKSDDLSAGVTISVPLWTSGKSAEAAAGARARLAGAEASLRARQKQLELAVALAEGDLARSSGEIGIARSSRAAAREELRIAGALAAEGRGSAADVARAQVALSASEEELANATQAVVAARVRILDLRGELPGTAGNGSR